LLEKPENVFSLEPTPAALLVDLEGTLTVFSPSRSSVIEALTHFEEVAAENGLDRRRLHYVTNAAFHGLTSRCPGISARLHTRAHKPFFTPPAQFQLYGQATVVVGDQYLTDGLLAWRFGFSFGLIRTSEHQLFWPHMQLSVGQLLSPLFFRLGERCR